VAVKIFNKEKMSEEDKISLETEIEILMQIDHPNIVRLLEVFDEEDHWCLVMELMEGGDLFS
jgi:calcium/calmodulin-dependent protein kinase I